MIFENIVTQGSWENSFNCMPEKRLIAFENGKEWLKGKQCVMKNFF